MSNFFSKFFNKLYLCHMYVVLYETRYCHFLRRKNESYFLKKWIQYYSQFIDYHFPQRFNDTILQLDKLIHYDYTQLF